MTEPSSPSALEKLAQRLASGSLHHALLFHGNDLNELERQARDLAGKALLMPDESSEHPDLFHLRPSGKMRIISVDKTRSLIGELNRSSNQGGAKVALLHEADRMKKAAANAFLKTLEEPPPVDFSFPPDDSPLFDPSDHPEPLPASSDKRLSLIHISEPTRPY